MKAETQNIRNILSILRHKNCTYVLYSTAIGNLYYAPMVNGKIDGKKKKPVILKDINGKLIVDYLNNARLVHLDDKFVLTYTTKTQDIPRAVVATGKNLSRLWVVHISNYDGSSICIVPNYKIKKHTIAFSGKDAVDLSLIDPTGKFIEHLHQLVVPRSGLAFDKIIRKPIGAIKIEEGVALFYDSTDATDDGYIVRIGLALCHSDDPNTFVCRSDEVPYWEGSFGKKGSYPECVGVYLDGDKVFFHFLQNNELYTLTLNKPLVNYNKKSISPLLLDRHKQNPLIAPVKYSPWESEGTFNPAVVDIDGKIHIFYRALGSDGVSRIGYANTIDGYNLSTRLPFPILDPNLKASILTKEQRRMLYSSGASSGGYEDPRSVVFNNRVYLTFSSFEGWGSIRITSTSISVQDLNANRWNWSPLTYLSPPGQIHKNWVIFPEKINNKYAILYSIAPKLLVKYVDSLDNFGPNGLDIPRFHPVGGNLSSWDNRLRGPGSPPIKTDLGWLVLYHATEIKDPDRYKLGAMILDIDNPTQILYRSPNPILEPDMEYENNWKPGVIYASGAVVRGDNLMVYYGGGDMHVALATCNLKELLRHLKDNKPYQLTKIKKYSI